MNNQIKRVLIKIGKIAAWIIGVIVGFNFQYIIDSFSNPQEEEKDSISEWSFGLNNLEMTNISVLMKDHTSGLDMSAKLNNFNIDMDELNLDSMLFSMDEIIVDGLEYSMVTTDSTNDLTDTAFNAQTSHLTIATRFFEIRQSSLNIQQAEAFYKANIGIFILEKAGYSTKKQRIELGSLQSGNCSYALQLPASDTAEIQSDDNTKSDIPWQIDIGKIALKSYQLSLKADGSKPIVGPVDPGNIDLKNIQVDMDNISIKDQVIAANVSQLAFLEQNSGINLNELKGVFKKDGDQYDLNDFKISALNTELNFSTNINLKDSFPEFVVDLTSAAIVPQDIQLFVPFIDTFPAYDNWPKINLMASIAGNSDSVKVDTLNAAFYNSNIRLKAGINHLLDSQKIQWKVPNLNIFLLKQDLAFFEADPVFPSDFAMPEQTEVKLQSEGSLSQGYVNTAINTSQGLITSKATFNFDSIMRVYKIDAHLNMDQLRPNQILTTLPIDTTTLRLQISGYWQDTTNAQADIDLSVQKCHFNQYTYENLEMNGDATPKSFNGKLRYKDANLEMTYSGKTFFSKNLKQFDFEIDIPMVNLQALHFTDAPFKCRGGINSQITLIDDKAVTGKLETKDISFLKKNEYLVLGDIVLEADTSNSNNTITLSSNLMDFQFSGSLALLETPKLFGNLAGYYFKTDSTRTLLNSSDHFSFDLNVKDTEVLEKIFLPDLNVLKVNRFSGSFKGDSSLLKLDIEIPKLSYASYNVDSLNWNIRNVERDMTGNLKIAQMAIGGFSINNFLLNSIFRNDTLHLNTSIQASDSIAQYRINTAVFREKDTTKLFVLDSVVLNRKTWKPSSNSFVEIAPAIWLEDLKIERENQLISFNSTQSNLDTIHEFSIKNFELGELNSNQDTLKKIHGQLNTHLMLENSTAKQPQMNGNLDIRNLAYGENDLGTLRASANTIENILRLALDIDGADNVITIKGDIATKEETEIDLKADFERFQVSILEPALLGTLDELKGILSGHFNINGPINQAHINGQLNIQDMVLQPTLTGVKYRIDREKIVFNNNRIVFDDFMLTDKNQKAATIDGYVDFNDPGNLIYQLDLSSNAFLVVNKKPSREDGFYGTAMLSNDTKIRGESKLIKINANLNIDDKSNLTYILPQSNKEAINRQNIVRFVDQDLQNDPFFENIDFEDTVQNRIQDITLNANISVAPESRFSIVVDPKSGDQLNLRGEANLAFEINPGR
jgi:hypothetical protein